jgi:hypothetical protein
VGTRQIKPNTSRKSKGTHNAVKGIVIAILFAVAGFLALHNSNAATLSAGSEAEAGTLSGNYARTNDVAASGGAAVKFGATTGGGPGDGSLLQPFSMGLAPYAYVPYGDVSMSDYSTATGAKNFFAAFILGTGCTPLWDGSASLGLTSSRSTAILSEMSSIRSKGGDVAISFGGASGSELANSCTNAAQLQTAYQSVIDKFSLKQINFDLEGSSETNAAAMTRRVQAVLAIQKAMPSLKVSLTIPVEPTGLDSDALNVVKKFHDGGIVVSSIDIMAMDFGSSSGAESGRVISAAQGTVTQIKQVYSGITTAQAYKSLGIIVLLGISDEPNESFTTTDAQAVHTFAVQNGVGTMSMWSANRDAPCGGGASLGNDNCSGVTQTKYQFANLLTIPAL